MLLKVDNCIIDAKEPDNHKYNIAPHTCYGFEGIYLRLSSDTNANIEITNNTLKDFKHQNILITSDAPYVVNLGNSILVKGNNLSMSDWVDYGGSFSLEAMIDGVKFEDNFLNKVKAFQAGGNIESIKRNIFYKVRDSDILSKPTNIGSAIRSNLTGGLSLSLQANHNIFYKCDNVSMFLAANNNGTIDGCSLDENIIFENGIRDLYPSSAPSGFQVCLQTNDARYSNQVVNTSLKRNIIFSSQTDKVIYYGSGEEFNNVSNYLTVAEADSNVKNYTDGTNVSDNTDINLIDYI